MRNVSDKIYRENKKTHILGSIFFFSENHAIYDNVKKYCRSGKTADESRAHAHCMLDT
jgi:hypothetical protein